MLKPFLPIMILFANLPMPLSYAANAASAVADSEASRNGQAVTPDRNSPGLITTTIPPLIILAPTEVRTDPTLAKGCWARLFPLKAFKGKDDLTIAGPLELEALHTPLGVNWKHKTQSMIVGPKASVAVYENQKLRGKKVTFEPGAQITDLRKEMPTLQTINSMKITCKG